MYNPYAFFDVDSLELSPNGRTYVCHPQSSSVSEELYEVYSIISSLSAPVLFTVDANRNTPSDKTQRCDFLTVPTSEDDINWKSSVANWNKFYISKDNQGVKEQQSSIFNTNENAITCVKLLQAAEWIVFGNGIENGVDPVMTTLLESVGIVKFIPELIIPGESESKDQLDSYCIKWKELGGISLSLEDVTEIVRCHKY